jgi:hypothetical protein
VPEAIGDALGLRGDLTRLGHPLSNTHPEM